MGATAWLVVLVLHGPGNGAYEKYYEQPNMMACETRLQTMRYEIPSGGDAEMGFVAFCSIDRSFDDLEREKEAAKPSKWYRPSTW